MTLKILPVTLGVAVMLAPTACAEPAPQNAGESPVVRQVFDQQTNVPGKSLISVTVSYPPGTKSEAHHHAKSAFIMAYVVSGAIRSQVDGEPARVYHAGRPGMKPPARTIRSVKMPAQQNLRNYSRSSCSIPETAHSPSMTPQLRRRAGDEKRVHAQA